MDDKQQDLSMQASSSSDFLGNDIWKRGPEPAPAAESTPEPTSAAAPTPQPPAPAPAFQEENTAAQPATPAPLQASDHQDAGAAGPEAGAPAFADGDGAAPGLAAPAAAAAPTAAVPAPAPAAAAPSTAAPEPAPVADSPSALVEKQVLTVGRGIRLVAKVCECESLTVEGHLEAAAHANSLVVVEGGCFMGSAEVEEAEISGTVEGNLTVSKRLTIRPTGRVSGTTRYQEIVIEAGGQILGTPQCLLAASDGTASVTAPGEAMAG